MTGRDRLQAFLAFSAEVVGFRRFELLGTGLVEDHLETVTGIVGEDAVDALLGRYCAIADADEGGRKAALRREIFGSEWLGAIARNIVKLWHIGTWYRLPVDWQQRYGPIAHDRTFVPSASAYTEGLLWRAIGAHPPGAKAPGFGSWQHPPDIPSFWSAPIEIDRPIESETML